MGYLLFVKGLHNGPYLSLEFNQLQASVSSETAFYQGSAKCIRQLSFYYTGRRDWVNASANFVPLKLAYNFG